MSAENNPRKPRRKSVSSEVIIGINSGILIFLVVEVIHLRMRVRRLEDSGVIKA